MQAEVFERLSGERGYQRLVWGTRSGANEFVEDKHSPGEYIVFMQYYLNEAVKLASTEPGYDHALEMLRKVTALGVACFEQNGVPRRECPKKLLNKRDGLPVVREDA